MTGPHMDLATFAAVGYGFLRPDKAEAAADRADAGDGAPGKDPET